MNSKCRRRREWELESVSQNFWNVVKSKREFVSVPLSSGKKKRIVKRNQNNTKEHERNLKEVITSEAFSFKRKEKGGKES